MRLLLAEDEKALSKALVKIFEKNNYAVDAVFNGEDALMYIPVIFICTLFIKQISQSPSEQTYQSEYKPGHFF